MEQDPSVVDEILIEAVVKKVLDAQRPGLCSPAEPSERECRAQAIAILSDMLSRLSGTWARHPILDRAEASVVEFLKEVI